MGSFGAAWRRIVGVAVVAAVAGNAAAVSASTLSGAESIPAGPVPVTGEGSSFVGPMMSVQSSTYGVYYGQVTNFGTTSAPRALRRYGAGEVDYAFTEIPYQWLAPEDQHDADGRGYQYLPVTAGGLAVMYHVDNAAGAPVHDLVLARRTIARIFMGDISNWSDPAIAADNPGVVLPNQPITVVRPAGESGTTAVFYDFAAHVAPDVYSPWAATHGLPTDRPPISLPEDFAPSVRTETTPEAIAFNISNPDGLWSIGVESYNYGSGFVDVARVRNAAGQATRPTAKAVTAALRTASVNADLTPNLDGVYDSPAAEAYPISTYSYVVTPCVVSPSAPTCKGAYADGPPRATAVAGFLRYLACFGQTTMEDYGYAPLPKAFSQALADGVGRLIGAPPQQLTIDNCSNPSFLVPDDPDAVYRTRAAGGDRIDTAIQLSRLGFLEGERAHAVVLARSDDSVDALAGTPLADYLGGPLLVTPHDALDPRVLTEMLRILPIPGGGPVYLLGGTLALGPAVEGALLERGYIVYRLAGIDRYETSVKIADAMGGPVGVILTTGRSVADALSAGAAAAHVHGAVLVTDDGRLPPVVADYLQRHPGTNVVAVGGPAAGAVPGIRAIVGRDRYETSALVASIFFPDTGVATFANGTTPDPSRPTAAGVDALAGGALAARFGGPVLLVRPDALPGPIGTWLAINADDLYLLIVYGGTVAVPESVVDQIVTVVEGGQV